MKRTQKQKSNLAKIREVVDPTLRLSIAIGQMQPGSKYFRMGKCRILLSPPYQEIGWHMSISCKDRYPTWEEITHARYELIPDDIEVAMMLPPKVDYVNVHEYTFHLHELVNTVNGDAV